MTTKKQPKSSAPSATAPSDQSVPSTLSSAEEPTLLELAEALAGNIRVLNRVLLDSTAEDINELTGLSAAEDVLARAVQIKAHQQDA